MLIRNQIMLPKWQKEVLKELKEKHKVSISKMVTCAVSYALLTSSTQMREHWTKEWADKVNFNARKEVSNDGI